MKEGIHVGIANETYHADRTAVSSTWLKTIDKKTPFHLRSYLDSPHVTTPALTMGSAVDCLIFEPELFNDQFLFVPETLNRRTNVGKQQWKDLNTEAESSNKMLLTNAQHGEALQTAKAIRTNPRMADILRRGIAQPVFVWRDPVTGLLCKCKLDWYDEEDGVAYDLKTAVDASPDGFSKAVGNFGYHIQQAFYSDGIRVCGKPCRRFVFAVQEKPDNRNTQQASPNLLAFYELTAEDDEAGRDAYSSALSAIDFCMTNNEWAGYTTDTVTITRPAWSKKTDLVSGL